VSSKLHTKTTTSYINYLVCQCSIQSIIRTELQMFNILKLMDYRESVTTKKHLCSNVVVGA